jgi:hypothetical protein
MWIHFINFIWIKFKIETNWIWSSFSPEFEQWSALRGRDSNVNFKRIQRLGSDLCRLSDCVVDSSGFERGGAISVNGTGSRQLFDRMDETANLSERPLSAPVLTFSKGEKILQGVHRSNYPRFDMLSLLVPEIGCTAGTFGPPWIINWDPKYAYTRGTFRASLLLKSSSVFSSWTRMVHPYFGSSQKSLSSNDARLVCSRTPSFSDSLPKLPYNPWSLLSTLYIHLLFLASLIKAPPRWIFPECSSASDRTANRVERDDTFLP